MSRLLSPLATRAVLVHLVTTIVAGSALAVGAWILAPTAQVAAALMSAVIAFVGAATVIGTHWRNEGIASIGATTFLWLGFAYFVGISAILNAWLGALDEYPAVFGWHAMLGVGIGAVCLLVGAGAARSSGLGARLPALPQQVPEWFVLVCVGGFLLVATLVRYIIYPGQFWLGGTFDVLPSSYGNYIQDLRHTQTVAGLLAVHALLTYRPRGPRRWLLMTAVLLSTIYSFFQFSRRPFVLLVVASVLYLLWTRRRSEPVRGSRVALVAGVSVTVLFAVAFVAAGIRYFTFQVGLENASMLDLATVLIRLGVLTVSQDSYAVYVASVYWFDDPARWLLGESSVQALGNVVPRALWPDKPESFGFTIAQLMGNYSTNFGPTFLGEGYANAGLGGVAIFGLLFGFAAATLDAYRRANPLNRSVVLLVCLLAFEAFPQVRGDLQGMTTPMVERAMFLSLPFITFALVRRFRGTREARATVTAVRDWGSPRLG